MLQACVACLMLLLTANLTILAQDVQRGARLKPVYADGSWGYADESGRIAIKPQFDAARPFKDGLAQVGVVDEELPELNSQPNIKWGYIDESGRVVVELLYQVLGRFSEGLAAVAVLDTKNPEGMMDRRRARFKWGYVDKSGRVVIPLQFFDAGDFSEGLAPVNSGTLANSSGPPEHSMCGPPLNYGYIDKTGAFMIKPQFTHAAGFEKGRARVFIGQIRYVGRCLCCAPRFDGKHGSIDRSGKFTPDDAQGGADSLPESEGRENLL